MSDELPGNIQFKQWQANALKDLRTVMAAWPEFAGADPTRVSHMATRALGVLLWHAIKLTSVSLNDPEYTTHKE